jgi:uncharacterized membrane protein YgaE (UPF0421/DUF939 family)
MWKMSSTNVGAGRTAVLQLAVRAAVAAGLSVAIARYLRFEQPIYAMIAAVIVTDLSPEETRRMGLARFGGTVVGAVVGALVSQAMRPNPFSVGLGILVSMLLSNVLRLGDAVRLAGYVSGIVLINYSEAPWHYSYRRLLETALGIGLAVLVSYVPKLIKRGHRAE